MSLCM